MTRIQMTRRQRELTDGAHRAEADSSDKDDAQKHITAQKIKSKIIARPLLRNQGRQRPGENVGGKGVAFNFPQGLKIADKTVAVLVVRKVAQDQAVKVVSEHRYERLDVRTHLGIRMLVDEVYRSLMGSSRVAARRAARRLNVTTSSRNLGRRSRSRTARKMSRFAKVATLCRVDPGSISTQRTTQLAIPASW